MALPSSKSSSATNSVMANPNLTRPLNPSSRSSEITNPMRRSFGGNPFTKPSIVANPRGFNPVTPANSPSEIPRRREGLSYPREQEEKENGKDPNLKTRQSRVRSPGISKGTKNFMSPTISAVSKFSASPRKQILSERNTDPIRSSSTSLSDLRSSCSSVDIPENSEEPGANMTIEVEASNDSIVTDSEVAPEDSCLGSKGSRKKVAFDSVIHEIPPMETTNVETEADLVNVDEEFLIPKSPCSYLLAPLDADPLVSLPPYDPKTNYLSPRPQFLHYRPSQRINHYVGEEGNVSFDPIEDGFDLEGLSDTDVTADDTSQSKQESDDASSNEATKEEAGPESKPDGLKTSEEVAAETDDAAEMEESDVASSNEATKGEAGPESKPDSLKTSEEVAAETDDAAEMEESVGVEELPKRSFFTRPMFIILIFIALATCSALVGTQYSPSGSYPAIEGPSFPAEAQQLRDNIAETMKRLYVDSFYYLSSLVSDFRGEEYELDELQFYNLTDLDENPWLGKNGIFVSAVQVDDFGNLEIGSEEEMQIEYSETEKEVIAENAADEETELPWDEPKEEEAVAKNAVDGGAEIPVDETQEQEGDKTLDKSLNTESEQEAKVSDAGMEEVKMENEETEFSADNHEAPQAAETECDKPELSDVKVENQPMVLEVEVTNRCDLPRVEVENVIYDTKQEQGSIESEGHNTAAFSINSESSEIVNSSKIISLVGVLLALLVAVPCLVYVRKRKTSIGVPSVNEIQVQNPLAVKKFDISPVTANQVTEFDLNGVGSCPSEISSFQKNAASSRSKRTKTGVGKNEEAQSSERKTTGGRFLRRESTASSFSDISLGSSPSYGSFTTYEMMPNKHRDGEEELVITPIRRSSRLRKQVTSP